MASLNVANELATAVYNKVKSTILNTVWPIGSVYISTNTTNPSTLFGGGWTRITGKFLLAADDSTYTNGSTGGEATHKLTISEMPSHNHGTMVVNQNSTNEYGCLVTATGGNAKINTIYSSNIGGSTAHNNMPPYLVVCIWKRTS